MQRRVFVSAAAGFALTAAVPFGRAQAAAGSKSLSFFNTHTGESLTARYRVDGVIDPAGKADIDYILRDWRAEKAAPIDPALLDLLVEIQARSGVSGPLHIISGYRTPETNAMLRRNGGGGVAKKSYHVMGQAIDVRLPGCPTKALRQCALDAAGGGVGYYRSLDFVHVDTGPVRAW